MDVSNPIITRVSHEERRPAPSSHQVLAPSKMERPAGDRVKTDRRDAASDNGQRMNRARAPGMRDLLLCLNQASTVGRMGIATFTSS